MHFIDDQTFQDAQKQQFSNIKCNKMYLEPRIEGYPIILSNLQLMESVVCYLTACISDSGEVIKYIYHKFISVVVFELLVRCLKYRA